jgi:hypothetical protein
MNIDAEITNYLPDEILDTASDLLVGLVAALVSRDKDGSLLR